jgi:hypothetical protein
VVRALLSVNYRLRKIEQEVERLGGTGGGSSEVATWNKAARLLVNSGQGGLPVAEAKVEGSRLFIKINCRHNLKKYKWDQNHSKLQLLKVNMRTVSMSTLKLKISAHPFR